MKMHLTCRKILFLLTSLITTCLSVQAQVYDWKLHFENYNIGQGLPSHETYDVITDNSGYLYISTDRGVVRYDGKQFAPVRFASYYKDYTLFEFTKDDKGTIWCSSYDKGLYYLKENRLHAYRYNDTLNKYRAGDVLEDFCIDSDGSIYFYLKRFGNTIGRIDSGGRFQHVATEKENRKALRAFFHAGKIIPLLYRSKEMRNGDLIHSTAVKPIQSAALFPDSLNIQKVRGQHTLFGDFIAAGNVLTVTYAGSSISNDRYFSQEILSFEVVDSALWVGTRGGLYYFPSLYNLKQYDLYFPNLGFNGICRDHQNGLWFASLQQGVFYLSPRKISVLDFPGHIDEFSVEGDTLLTFHAIRRAFYSASLKTPEMHILKMEDYRSHIQYADVAAKRVCPLPGDIAALCLSNGFLLYSDKQNAIVYDSRSDSRFTERVLCIELFRDTIWIGTANGMYVMVDKHIAKWQPGEEELNTKVADIKADGDKAIWIATLGNGLYSYDKALKPHPEVSVAFAESIYVDEDRDVWVGSNVGIFLKTRERWFCFAERSGLPPSYTHKIVYKNKQVYGLCGNKLFRFSLDKKNLKKTTPYAKLYVNLLVDGKARNADIAGGAIMLTRNERYFRVKINNPNFESAGYSMAYRVAGKDTAWTDVEGNAFTLTDIAPGKHNVQVRYTEKITPANSLEFTINLIKEPKWTQTLWFQILLILLGGLITIPPGIFIFKGLLEKRRLYYEKILADQRVLSTQLNPHFTYNALNSMQLLLYGKKWNSALAYNEGLGKILRSVFRQSEKTFVSLAQELDLVKEYLELEKIRLHRKIDFVLKLDKNTDPDAIPIPPLLIQPLVENAIWHGYRQQSQQLEIQCTISMKSKNEVCISISDNGKGFEQSLQKNVHSALKNMLHRIELLNSSQLVNIDMNTYSPLRSDGKAGTEIILTIHYLHEKESNHYRR